MDIILLIIAKHLHAMVNIFVCVYLFMLKIISLSSILKCGLELESIRVEDKCCDF